MKLACLFIILLPFTGCIKQATLTYRKTMPLLVVDGLLLTDSTPCKITLSFSGLFTSYGYQDNTFIDDASVFVKDGAGDSIKLTGQGNGVYLSDGSLHAKTGNAYSLSITLHDGRRYASFPEKIVPVPLYIALDSVGQNIPPVLSDLFAADIQIRFKDPPGEKNYYRWASVDYLSRVSYGACPPNTVGPCYDYCFQSYNDPAIYTFSDEVTNGSDIRYQHALLSPYYFYGRHYIEIKQLSLTKQAYEFWHLYQDQTSRTGGILDPLPAPIQGNIYNVDDSTQLALGYFEASDAASLKFILAPLFINGYFTLMHATNYIAGGECAYVYPNAVKLAPPGWDNAPEYIVNVY